MTRRTVVALLITLPWAAWALVRGFGLDDGYPLVALMALTPYAAATALVPVAVTLALGTKRVALLAIASLIALASVLLAREDGTSRIPATATGPELRVLTLNTHLGGADMRAVLRLSQEQHVQLIALQELTPAGLARFDAVGGRRLFPGRFVQARTRAAGSGLFARRALTDHAPDDATAAEQPDALLTLPGAVPVRVKTVHPYPPLDGKKARAWRASLDRLPRPGRTPRVILGDFNATLDDHALREVVDRGDLDAADVMGKGLTPTWRQHLHPPLTIDHVLFDPRLGIRDYQVHDIAHTDHRAVIATLVLPHR